MGAAQRAEAGFGMRCQALLALVLSLSSAAEGLQLSESTTAKPLTQLVGREYLTELKPQAKDGQSWAQMSAQLERIEAKLAMLLRLQWALWRSPPSSCNRFPHP